MYNLKILFPTWVIDYETFRGKANSFIMSFGPFDSEQQARWFWLTMKEKLQRNYDIAVIVDDKDNEVYIDEKGM